MAEPLISASRRSAPQHNAAIHLPPENTVNTAEIVFTAAVGFMLGAGTVGILWVIDRWRNRPYLTEQSHD